MALFAIGRLQRDSRRIAEIALVKSSDAMLLLNAGNDDFDSTFIMNLAGGKGLCVRDLCNLYTQIGESMMRTGTQRLRGALSLVIEQISGHMKNLKFDAETAEDDVLSLAVIISGVPELREEAEGILKLYLDTVLTDTMLSYIFDAYDIASNVPSAFNLIAEHVEVPDWVHDHVKKLVADRTIDVQSMVDLAVLYPASRFTLHRAYRDLLASCDVPTLLEIGHPSANFRTDWLKVLRSRAAEIEAFIDETETLPAA